MLHILYVLRTREISVFYLFRHLTSTRADLARLGWELCGKLRGLLHLTVCWDIWMVIFWEGSLQIYCHAVISSPTLSIKNHWMAKANPWSRCCEGNSLSNEGIFWYTKESSPDKEKKATYSLRKYTKVVWLRLCNTSYLFLWGCIIKIGYIYTWITIMFGWKVDNINIITYILLVPWHKDITFLKAAIFAKLKSKHEPCICR